MAEGAVSYALQSLGSLLVQEINLLGSTKQEVERIKSELETIASFLKDADARAAQEVEGGGNEGVKTWVKQVREEAYRIEDVIDEFSLSVAHLPHGRGLVCILHKISRFVKKLILRHEIATEIKEIKSSLANIRERTQTYGLRSIYQEGTKNVIPHDSRVDSLFIEDTEVVGTESTKRELIDWLVKGSPQRSVIAVVGEGGLGKSTLARKIYDTDDVKKHFDCQAWITVGKEYMKKDLLCTILQRLTIVSASGETDKMEDLITTLRKYLKDKCYMIVFDDVCKLQFWGDVEHALLDNKKSSRIMLTTRNKGVADFVRQSSVVQLHMLEPLDPHKAWKLFCKKAFRFNTDNGRCPSELKELSEKIVAKCGGLPLAIAAVGGLLSTKNKDVSEWKKLLDGVGSKLGSDPYLESCNRVLLEGYYDLPHHLKSCLLYFGLFPESYSISCGRLIRLWIAEGFVQDNGRPFEEVAEEYLTELIDRSLVQVSVTKLSGRVKSCRVHDLMHEVILRKTKELGFCLVLNGEDFNNRNKIRRISVHKRTGFSKIKESKVRSVLFSDVDKVPDAFMINFKLLKVLDFENAHDLECLPKGVGELLHLRYLSVRETKVKILPNSIDKLVNLETLDSRQSFVSELPIKISNLRKLRHLRVNCWVNNNCTEIDAVNIQEGFGSLANLRKLDYVIANNYKVVKEVGKLKQLRKLGISLNSNGCIRDLFASIEDMKNLESFFLKLTSAKETPDLQFKFCPPQCLQTLQLYGIYIKKLPEWIFKLQNLIWLDLQFDGSIVEPLRLLQPLPNLLRLRLEGIDCDKQLHFEEGWLPKLRILSLHRLKKLESMKIGNGTMPNLIEWYIGPCPLLKEIPNGIQHLKNLKILSFRDMLNEIYHMIKDKNWEKVTKHIPKVLVTYQKRGKNYSSYSTKYLSSLSPQDIQQLINGQKRPNS